MLKCLILLILLAPSALQARALDCTVLLGSPDKPLVERIATAYEQLLRGDGFQPAALAEYQALAAKADQAELADFFGFKQSASPERSVLQDGLGRLLAAVYERVRGGEISESAAKSALASVVRKLVGEAKTEHQAQERTVERRDKGPLTKIEADPELVRNLRDSMTGGHWGTKAAATEDGGLLAVTTFEFTFGEAQPIVVFSPKTGKQVNVVFAGSPALKKDIRSTGLAFSPDGNYLVAVSFNDRRDRDNSIVTVWNTKDWSSWTQRLKSQRGSSGDKVKFVFSPDSSRVYLEPDAGANAAIFGYELANGAKAVSKPADFRNAHRGFSLTPDGQGFAVLAEHAYETDDLIPHARIDVYDSQTKRKCYSSGKIPACYSDVTFFSIGSNGEILIENDDRQTTVWKLKGGKPALLGRRATSSVLASPSRNYHLTKQHEKLDALWNGSSRKFVPLEKPDFRRKPHKEFALFSPDEKTLIGIAIDDAATPGFVQTLHIWDIPSGRYIESREFRGRKLRFLASNSRTAYFFDEDRGLFSMELAQEW